MKKILLLFINLFIISFSGTVSAALIIYPWRATTAIVKSGESFEVWFDADNGQTVSAVQLLGPYNTVECLHSTVTGYWIYDKYSNNKFDTKITVTLPSGTPADRYDLVLKTSTGDVKSTGAVKVIKAYKSDYYILHMSDAHRAQGGHDENLILTKISTVLDIANIIDPEIIFETGDNQYNVRNHPEREQSYFHGIPALGIKGMNDAFAATFMTPGNHDTPSNGSSSDTDPLINSQFYNKYYGLQSYNFTYGKARFMVMNNAWLGFNPTQQITDAAAWLNTVGTGNLRVGAFHGPSGARVEDLVARVNINAGMAGHVHHSSDNPWTNNVYAADDMRESFLFNLYKVNGATGTWTPVGGTTAAHQALENPADILTPALYKPNLTLEYAQDNTGTSATNSATIINHFSFPIQGARVRFLMPLGTLYSVSQGVIEQSFDGTLVHVVDVSVDLGANSTTVVDIASSSIVDQCPNDPFKTEPGECGCGVIEGTCTTTYVTDVILTPLTVQLNIGSTQQLSAKVVPADATDQNIIWSSSHPLVASVDLYGSVTALAEGTTSITAKSNDGGKTAVSEITVLPHLFVLQAEDAAFNGPAIATNQAGYHGTGFLDFTNPSNDFITWTVNVPTSKTYSLSFRYAQISNRPLKLTINGDVKIPSINFPITADWAAWKYYRTSQPLNAGNNTVTLTAIGSSGGNFDELAVSEEPVVTSISKLFKKDGKSFNIYPNPYSQGDLFIDMEGFESAGLVQVSILNLTGQVVCQQVLTGTTNEQLNLSGKLNESVYLVSIESGDSRVVKKLIVK